MSALQELRRHLKMNSGQLKRFSRVAERNEGIQRSKLRMAIKRINKLETKLRAKLIITRQNEALNYKRMSAKVDAVIFKLPNAITMKQVANVRPVLKALDKAISAMKLRKISYVMELVEQQFENLDVSVSVDEAAVERARGISIPLSQVTRLILETAVHHGLVYHLARADVIRTGEVAQANKVCTGKAVAQAVVRTGEVAAADGALTCSAGGPKK